MPEIPDICNLPYSNQFFIGREHYLCELNDHFWNDKTGGTPQIMVGMKGIGKTKLAEKYACLHATDYRIIYQFDPRRIEDDFKDLLTSLINNNYVILHADIKSLSTQEIYNTVIYILEKIPKWLLIFDGWDDAAQLAHYIPRQSPLKCQHVLITSSTMIGWQEIGNIIPLTEFTSVEATTIFKSILRRKPRPGFITPSTPLAINLYEKIEPELLDLCQALNCFPLAVEEAAWYMKFSTTSPKDYLDRLKKARKQLWKYQAQDNRKQTISTIWQPAIDKMIVDEAAKNILYCCAFLNATDIPKSIFYHSEIGTDLEVDGAIKKLLDHFLLDYNEHSNTLTLFSLLQLVVQDSIAPTDNFYWIQKVLALKALPQHYNWEVIDSLQLNASNDYMTEYRKKSESLKQQCLDKVIEYVDNKIPIVINNMRNLPSELSEPISNRRQTLATLLKYAKSPVLSNENTSNSPAPATETIANIQQFINQGCSIA